MDIFDMMMSGGSLPAPKPSIKAVIKLQKEVQMIDHRREIKGTNYAKSLREKEELRLIASTLNMPSTSDSAASTAKTSDDSDDEDGFTLGLKDEKEEPDCPRLSFYQQYQFGLPPQELPILNKRSEILEAIERDMVIVLSAQTGTGKSSQVPQYILEDSYKKNKDCNIIITQPRRIAATSIAKRVALERRCEIGTLVGYQIGLDKKMDAKINSDTRILFCTTGVLLQKLISEKSLKKYSHVILDEIHERDIETDMLLILVHRLLATKNNFVKVILMSATMSSEKIAEYFKHFTSRGVSENAPTLDLEVPRRFPIKVSNLDELEAICGVTREMVNPEVPGISKQLMKVGVNFMNFLKEKLKQRSNFLPPSFLIFLPGIQEIQRFKDELYKPSSPFDISDYHLTVLHSSIPTEDFAKAFDGSVDRKIILATNIAESSVTLPGVRFVIDFCLTKYQETDTATNMTRLKLDWASKNSLKQREGRVGRTELGQVIRMIYKDHEASLPEETKPEIQRASLESVVLKTKQLNMGSPSEILGLALDPPPRNAIIDSILVLKEIGGLTRASKKSDEMFSWNDGELTFTGLVMARLPVDIRISKLILLGYLFSCLEECIIIGAGMSSKGVFKQTTADQKMEEFHQRFEQAKGTGSDAIVILNAYQSWRKAVANNLRGEREKKWCNEQLLALKNLREIHELVEDIKKRLEQFRLDVDDIAVGYKSEEEKLFVLKICIAGAFYPNYFLFGGSPPAREDYKELKNSNPSSTIFFKGVEVNRLGQLYEQQIREKLFEAGVTDNVNGMQVKFDRNSTRLMVEFKSQLNDHEGENIFELVPGEVRLEVYKAVKLGKLEKKIDIKVLENKQKEEEFAAEKGLGTWRQQKFEFHKKTLKASSLCIYPKICDSGRIPGFVTHIVNGSKFFFQPLRGRSNVQQQQEILTGQCIQIPSLNEVAEGNRLIVKHEEVLKRGKIIDQCDDDGEIFLINLIDTGEVVKLHKNDFYTCENLNERERKESLQFVFEMPPQCFECRLAEVIPSAIKCPTGWSEQSTQEFQSFIDGKKLEVEVNSFVDRIASVRLFAGLEVLSLNEHLVVEGFARTSDDSYLNLKDQHERENSRNEFNEFKHLEDELNDNLFITPPSEELLSKKMSLEGPKTPLESQLRMLLRDKSLRFISTDSSSINHVLIDPYPNDPTQKALVAATMTRSENDSRVTLHQTTLLPNLPGIACLLTLIFSPAVEVRRASKKNHYTTILAGLGANEKGKPNFGEHDLLVDVDVDLDQEDFKKIKELRENMSFVLQNQPGFKYQSRKLDHTRTRQRISSLLLEIAQKTRSSLIRSGDSAIPSSFNWKTSEDSKKWSSETYAAHETVERLMPLSENTRRDLRRHFDELKELAATNSRDEENKCRLCGETLKTLEDLQLHVLKKMHKERIVRIRDETLQ